MTKTFGACVTATAGGAWQNNAITAQTGTFTATCDATPSASPTNAVVALTNGAQTSYSNFACLVRFNPSGDIDARNGGAYAAASTIPYSANVSYHFRLVVNVSAKTYSIYVTPAGGSELTVGSNYAFRISETSLNDWGVYVDSGSGGAGSLTVCNFSTGTPPPQVATPTFSPAAGTYSSAQNVTISDSTSGATIYYTTDGSTPTTSSAVYSSAIPVSSGTVTINAIGAESGFTNSNVATAAYTIGSPPPPPPTFSPAGGTYTSAQNVSINFTPSGASIYYTTNGTTPTTASTVYSSPILVSSGSVTLEAIAVVNGVSSAVASATYTISSVGNCVTATAGGGWQNSALSGSQTGTFTFTCDATPSASPTNAVVALSNGAQTSYSNFACLVRFNPSGDIDARNGSAYAAASTIPYSADVSYHFRLVINVAAKTYSIYATPAGGSELTVGSNYAFRIADTALNYWGAYVDSGSGGSGSLTVCNFTLGGGPAAPTFSPAPGTYTAPLSVTISDSTAGATIYYTTDDTAPTTSSTVYSGPVSMPVGTTVLSAIAANAGGSSLVTSGSYTVTQPVAPPSPTFSPASGTYPAPLTVTIADSVSGVTISYTTDGSVPTETNGTVYSGPITLSVGNWTFSAIAFNGNGASTAANASYTVTQPVAPTPPTFSPASGTYAAPLTVTIADSTNGATIHYTTDGSAPTASSTVYSGPITLQAGNWIFSAIAVNGNGASTATDAGYTVTQPVPPSPTFSPAPGSYTAPLSVTITDATGGVTIYYTTDGSTPTTSSITYTGPVPLPSSAAGTTTTLSAIAVGGGGSSTPAVGSYTVTNGGGTAATPLFSPAAGPFYAATPVTISSATAGATIRYTTDGSTPTETNGSLYTGPVNMPVAVDTNMSASTATNGSGITMLKAVAYKSGMTDSAVFTGNYIIIVPLRYPKTTSMVLGMAHMAYNVTSANWNGIFKIWTNDIGYAAVEVTGTSPNRFALIKINDQQFIELYEVTSLPSTGVGGYPAQYQLRNWGFYVTDAKAFQSQVQSAGVSITKSVSTNALGNLSFFTTDTDGHSDEWLQYIPGSVTSQTLGQNMPGTQLFGYIQDFGDATANVTAANDYYAKFGFKAGGVKVYMPNNNCYMEMLTYTTLTQAEAGVHEKTQLVNFRGFTIQQSGQAVVARDPNIPRVVTGTEGGSGFPTHAYYDLYNADLSRIRLIDINY